MANFDSRFGLRPYKMPDGSSVPVRAAYIPASYGTALFVGEPIVITGTSNTAAAGLQKQYIAGSLPEINRAGAGSGASVTGAIVGFEYNPDNLYQLYNPANTERIAFITYDAATIYLIQGSGTIAATDVGSNADLVYTHAGDTTTGLSGAELDTTTFNTTATLQLKLLSIQNALDNELGTNTKALVTINTATIADNIAGI